MVIHNTKYIIMRDIPAGRSRLISGHVSLSSAKVKLKFMRAGSARPNSFRIYKRMDA